MTPATETLLRDLLTRLRAIGWRVVRDPQRRGVILARDLEDGGAVVLPPEAHELLAREDEVFDLLERDRMAREWQHRYSGTGAAGRAPLVEGGEGKPAEETETSATVAACCFGGIAVLTLVAWLAGWLR